MHVVVGLGNPGREYDETRHNVGFMLADIIAREAGSSISQIKFHSLSARVQWEGCEILLLKPQTYMNLSGGPVQEALSFFKVPPANLILLFDDLDQIPGAVRTRFGGGHGGHNGVRDVLAKLGTDEFHRVKIGIGKPDQKSATASWVLSKLSSHESVELEQNTFKVAKQRLKEILKKG